jgi:hypothetical protein
MDIAFSPLSPSLHPHIYALSHNCRTTIIQLQSRPCSVPSIGSIVTLLLYLRCHLGVLSCNPSELRFVQDPRYPAWICDIQHLTLVTSGRYDLYALALRSIQQYADQHRAIPSEITEHKW